MPSDRHLYHYLSTKRICIQEKINSQKALLEKVAQLLASAVDNTPHKQIYHGLLEREKLGNTGIGNGVALPHSRFEGINEPILTVVTLSTPINYDSLDQQAISMVFGLLAPSNTSEIHLQLLANIAKILSDEKKREQLQKSDSPQKTFRLFKQFCQHS